MKILLVMLFAAHLSTGKDHVFLCKGGSIVTYHAKKDCRNIKTCSQEVLEVSLEEATDQYKKKACKVCYREVDLPLFPSPIIIPIEGWDE